MPETSNSTSPSTPEPTPAPLAGDEGQRGLIRNAGTVGIWTIVSRVLGLYRFRLLASIFGATAVADAFNFAFIFPNLTRRLFGEGLLTSAFVPIFSDRLAKGQKDDANRTASVLLCRLFYWLSLGCIAIIAGAEAVRWIWPTFRPLKSDDLLLIRLFQWMMPYLIFINLAAVFMAILNSFGHFLMPALAPVVLNIFMIVACLFVVPHFGTTLDEKIWAVAYAVLLGGLVQLLIQFPPAFARGFRLKLSMDKSDAGHQEVMANFKPVVLMVAVFQLNVLMDNVIARNLISGDGPVTYLNMGTSVYQLPWSIFSLALGTAALPMLSVYWAQAKKMEFARTTLLALRLIIFLAIPCTVGIMLLSDEIVRLLYGTGRFLENNAEPVRRTAGVVLYSSLGLVFFSVNSILARALYAVKDMKTPTTTSAQSVAINLAFNLFFVVGLPFFVKPLLPMREALSSDQKVLGSILDVLISAGNMKESGIALASTISNGWQTWMLARALRNHMGPDAALLPPAFRVLGIFGGFSLVSIAGGIFGYSRFAGNPDWEGFASFFGAALGSLIPFWFLSHRYFLARLKNKEMDSEIAHYRYGVKEEDWSDELKFEYSIYSTIMSSTIMGFLVWAVRDSLPPEGAFIPVLQRAVVPVVVGVFVYATAASAMMSREYDELKDVFERRMKQGLIGLVLLAIGVAFAVKMGWIKA